MYALALVALTVVTADDWTTSFLPPLTEHQVVRADRLELSWVAEIQVVPVPSARGFGRSIQSAISFSASIPHGAAEAFFPDQKVRCPIWIEDLPEGWRVGLVQHNLMLIYVGEYKNRPVFDVMPAKAAAHELLFLKRQGEGFVEWDLPKEPSERLAGDVYRRPVFYARLEKLSRGRCYFTLLDGSREIVPYRDFSDEMKERIKASIR